MLFRGDFVQSGSLGGVEILHDYLLCVNVQGYIDYFAPAAIERSQSISSNRQDLVTLSAGSFLLPTFCDLHLHAPQFLYQGNGLHLPLMQWLDEYAFKAEERLDMQPDLAEVVYKRLAARLIEHGTGAVMLFGTIKTETNLILARAMQAAGLRAFVGKLSMDISSRPSYNEASASAALEAAQAFCDRCTDLLSALPPHSQLVQPVLTPRFVPTCSDTLLSGLGAISARDGLRIQSHMAEAHDEVEWVLAQRGADDMDVFDRSSLLTPRTVQAHCTFLDPPALSRLATTGTAVAHCPLSNAYFSAEPFRLREALDAGVRVGLGTDIAGGYSVNIMDAMRHAVTTSRMREGARIMRVRGGGPQEEDKPLSVDWKEALFLATAGGAAALNLPVGSGTFAVGVPFDAQCIRLFDPDTAEGVGSLDFFDDPRAQGLTLDAVEKWWCLGDARNRTAVWVQGKLIGT